jgi:hypothetical protein
MSYISHLSCCQSERISTYKYNSLAMVLRLTLSYLQVIALILQKAHICSRLIEEEAESNPPGQSLIGFLNAFNRFQSGSSMSDLCGSSWVNLFDYFENQLRATEYAVVADNIFEILSTVAFIDDDLLLLRLVNLSWTSLHTVYIDIDDDHNDNSSFKDQWFCPYAVIMSGHTLAPKSYMAIQKSRIRIVHQILSKICPRRNDSIPQVLHLKIGLIRHWGILTASNVGLPYLLRHLSSLVTSLVMILESIDISFKHIDLENDTVETKILRKKKSSQPSSIIGLDGVSFSEFFNILLNLVVAAAGTLNSGRRVNDNSESPYKDIQECFGIFRYLLEIYKDHIHLFPRKTAVSIFFASKDVLAIAVCQLQICVEWRMDQPIRKNQKQTLGQLDIGSIHFLEQLIDRILSHTAAPILSLCDIWQPTTGIVFLNKTRISSLRLTVEKSIQQIKDTSLLHNFSNPSFGVGCDKIEPIDPTNGFHILPQVLNPSKVQSLRAPNFSSTAIDFGMLKNDDDESKDDDDSFGVIGNWGEGSTHNVKDDDDESFCSLKIQNSGEPILQKVLKLSVVSQQT